MKTHFLLFSLLFFFPILSKSQVYSSGDLSLTLSYTPSHDSTFCHSTCIFTANITKSNSFIGDVVNIKYQNPSTVISSITNTLGQNPWVFSNNFKIDTVQDLFINSGNISFATSNIKVLSGLDSIQNLQPSLSYTVPNACEFDEISGKIYMDENNDCIINNIDSIIKGFAVKAEIDFTNQPSKELYTYLDTTGFYTFKIQKSWMSNITIKPYPAFQFSCPSIACNSNIHNLNFNSLPQTNANFALQKENNVDVETNILTVPNIIPNKPFYLSSIAKNLGFHHTNIILTLVKDTKTTYVDSLSFFPATSINGDTISWNFGSSVNIQSSKFEHWNRNVGAFLIPNANAVVGDTLCFLAYTNIPGNDADTTNNSYKICIPVVNNYDETQKTVTPKGDGVDGNIPMSTEWLTYTIHFKNIILDSQSNFFIVYDTIDANLDLNTIDIIGCSMQLQAEMIAPNVIRFTHYENLVNYMNANIDSAFTEKQIKYRVKLKPNLPQGTQIKNNAQIHLIGNSTTINNTNTCINTLAYPNQLISKYIINKIEIFPNPARDNISIKFFNDNNIKNRHIKIMTMNGQVVKEINSSAFSLLTIDVKDLNTGIYFIKILEKDKVMVSKFVIEK